MAATAPPSALGLLWRVFKMRWFDFLVTWIGINVGFGTVFLWGSALIIALIKEPRGATWRTNVLNGSLAVYVITLCVGQIEAFMRVSKDRILPRITGALLLAFIALTLVASFVSAMSSDVVRQRVGLDDEAVATVSWLLFWAAVLTSSLMTLARFTTETNVVAVVEAERQRNIAETARTETAVDGAKL